MCPAGVVRGAEDQEAVRAGEDEALSGPEAEEESEETRQARPASDLGAPAKAEYDRHMLSHVSYRTWCPWCASGCGRSSQHRRAKEHDAGGGVPVVAMDYCCYMTETRPGVVHEMLQDRRHRSARDVEQGSRARPCQVGGKILRQHGTHSGCA